jgi:hypothetical protein
VQVGEPSPKVDQTHLCDRGDIRHRVKKLSQVVSVGAHRIFATTSGAAEVSEECLNFDITFDRSLTHDTMMINESLRWGERLAVNTEKSVKFT